jgi:hypothetical protein
MKSYSTIESVMQRHNTALLDDKGRERKTGVIYF